MAVTEQATEQTPIEVIDSNVEDTPTPQAPEKPELFAFTDPQTGEIVQITEKQRTAIGHHTAVMRKKETAKIQAKFEEMQAKYNENTEMTTLLSEELQSMKEAELSAEERAERKIAKEQENAAKEFETLKAERDNNFNMFKERAMQTDMFAAVGKHQLNNAQHSLQLLMGEGKAEFVKNEDNGKWETVLTLQDDIGEIRAMTPVEAADRYFNLPENAYQLQASIKAGAGSSQSQHGTSSTSGQTEYTRDKLADPKAGQEYWNKIKNNETVNIQQVR